MIGDSLSQVKSSLPKIPISVLKHGMDSEVTAQAMDQVDLGNFQANKVFTKANGEALIALATASYSAPEDQMAHFAKQKNVKSVHILSSANNAALGIPEADRGGNLTVVETEDALLVAARGTSAPWAANHGKENAFNFEDLVADFNATAVLNHAGTARVHAGFKNQADSVWVQLKPLLQTAMAANKAIHMTGHSLGAAVAVHLFERTKQELGISPQALIRFAAPNVGWSAEKNHLDNSGTSARMVNVIHSGDPVPLALPFGKSAGTDLYIDRYGMAEIKSGRHTLDSLAAIADDFATGHAVVPLSRHFPQYYIQGMSSLRNVDVLAQLEERMNG